MQSRGVLVCGFFFGGLLFIPLIKSSSLPFRSATFSHWFISRIAMRMLLLVCLIFSAKKNWHRFNRVYPIAISFYVNLAPPKRMCFNILSANRNVQRVFDCILSNLAICFVVTILIQFIFGCCAHAKFHPTPDNVTQPFLFFSFSNNFTDMSQMLALVQFWCMTVRRIVAIALSCRAP